MDGSQAEHDQEGEGGKYCLGRQLSSCSHIRGEQHKHDGCNTDSEVGVVAGPNECSSENYQ